MRPLAVASRGLAPFSAIGVASRGLVESAAHVHARLRGGSTTSRATAGAGIVTRGARGASVTTRNRGESDVL